MTEQKRGKNVAIVGLVLQAVFSLVLLYIWLSTDSVSALAGLCLMGGGLPVWLMELLLFYCRQLESRERLELEELRRSGGDASLFETPDGQAVRPALRRLQWMDRWITPIFTFLWAVVQGGLGAVLLYLLLARRPVPLTGTMSGAVLCIPVAFLAFLFSRYSFGMSRDSQWRLLRGAGSYTLACAIFGAGVAGSLLAGAKGYIAADLAVAYVGAGVQLLLSVELLLNMILDFYRPRLPGDEGRPPFDSRLLNLLADPGRVGHSIAETLNYQFGFEVSKTWFYKLASRAIVPLFLFAGLVLTGLSSVMIVNEGEQYVVLHLGRADAGHRTLKPGIHFKLPWPFETAQRFDTGTIQEILLGVGQEQKPQIVGNKEIYLWTQEHGRRQELDFVIGIPGRSAGTEAPPVNIIKLVVGVHYRVADPYQFGFSFRDSAKALENLAYRAMTSYCASATLDGPAGGTASADRPEAIMTYGRQKAAEGLRRRIQASADAMGLGVTILDVALSVVHPPAEAAAKYEEVLQAERGQDQQYYEALSYANDILGNVAGTPTAALELSLTIQKLADLKEFQRLQKRGGLSRRLRERMRQVDEEMDLIRREMGRQRLVGKVDDQERLLAQYQAYRLLLEEIVAGRADLSARIVQASQAADQKFAMVSGQPAAAVATAEGYRISRQLSELALANSFAGESAAYNACPAVYMVDRWLDVWDGLLPNINKYVLGVKRDKIQLWLNWENLSSLMQEATFDSKGK